MLSRRDLMGKLAASSAVLWAASAARASLTPSSTSDAELGFPTVASVGSCQGENLSKVDTGVPETESARSPWELFYPLAIGSVVANGWKMARLSGVVDGSCVLTLEDEGGRAHRIHLCRNGGRPRGLVYTDHFDLLVMNGGQGDLPTDEGFAKAVADVAHVLAANERAHATTVASLMSQDERLQRSTGADRRLR